MPERSATTLAQDKSRHESAFETTCAAYENHREPAAGIVLVGGSDRRQAVRQWPGARAGAETEPLWFRIGSLTKTLVSFSALHFALTARQDPNADISADFRAILDGDPGGNLTLMSLLAHTAGFLNCTALADPTREIGDVGGLRRQGALGAFSYSNLGYALAGLWLQHKTGLTFAEVLSRHVLMPLGISDTALAPPEGAPRAEGHVMDPGRGEVVPMALAFNDPRFAPAGYLWSTLNGLERLMHGLLYPADPMTAKVVELMKRPVSPPFGPGGVTSCPGLFRVPAKHGAFYFNEGEIAGFRSRLELDFEAATGLATVAAYSGPEDADRPSMFAPLAAAGKVPKDLPTRRQRLPQGVPTFLAPEFGLFQCEDPKTMRNARLNGVPAALEEVGPDAWVGRTDAGRVLTVNVLRLDGRDGVRLNGHIALATQLRWRAPELDPRWFGEYRNGYWIRVEPSKAEACARVSSTYNGTSDEALVLGPNLLASDMGLIVFGPTPGRDVLRLLGTARFLRVPPAS